MEKNFKAHIILNWKNGSVSVKKRNPKKLNPYEIPLLLNITLEIPEVKEYEVKGKMTIPETKVNEMLISEL